MAADCRLGCVFSVFTEIVSERKNMFWDKVSGLYDFFETVYNGKVYRGGRNK